MKKLSPSYIVGGNANNTAAVENSLVVLQNVKHTITLGASHCTSRYVPRRTGHSYLHRNRSTDVHSTLFIMWKQFIHQ